MKQIIIRVPDDLHKRLKLASVQADTSMKEVVIDALARAEQGGKPAAASNTSCKR